MSLKEGLRAVAGVFVELPPEETSSATAPAKSSLGFITTPSTVKASPAVQASSYGSLIDPTMLATLQGIITKRRTPYTSLVEAADQLKEIIPDDIMRLKAAAKQTKASKDSINQAIAVHIADIEGASTSFARATESQLAQKSGSLRDNAKSLQEGIINRTNQIEDQKKLIAHLEEQNANEASQIGDLNSQADAAEVDIKATAQKFDATVDSVKSTLTNQKSQLIAIL